MSSDLIEQVKLNYKHSLFDKAAQLKLFWRSAESKPDDLLSFLHQLAGSAGMYGYDAITNQTTSLRAKLQSTDSINQFQNDFQKLHKLLIESSESR